ncbi:hypothetical protein ACERK3_17065 [Phycisphaerales bacterium AB-hyl4]|uniref:Uncharacterized protein n=1 Tax=Natronomicrosphaera hydrolytica TaxID=3242702 RepID=A0ABV4U9N0_9BACT
MERTTSSSSVTPGNANSNGVAWADTTAGHSLVCLLLQVVQRGRGVFRVANVILIVSEQAVMHTAYMAPHPRVEPAVDADLTDERHRLIFLERGDRDARMIRLDELVETLVVRQAGMI